MSASTPPSVPSPSGVAAAFTAVGRFFFRYRNYLAPVGVLLVLVASPPRQFLWSEQADRVWDVLGLLVALVGQTVRMLTIGLAYIKRGGRDRQLEAKRLVCEGVYAQTRNPMYVGNFLLLTGLAMIYNSVLGYLVALPVYVGAILAIIGSEEDFLRGKFGAEYDDYCRRVPRFVPRFQGFGQTLATMPFDWRQVIAKEYGTTFAWTSVALALLAREQVAWHGVAESRTALVRLGVAWLAVAALWATARWLKKTRRLRQPAA